MAYVKKIKIGGVIYTIKDGETAEALASLLAGTKSTGNASLPAETYWVPTSTVQSQIEALLNKNIVVLKGVLSVANGDTVAQTLAAVSSPAAGDLYLILDEDDNTQYAEYVYTAAGAWERLGVVKADIDISGKADKTEVSALFNAIEAEPNWDTTAADPTAEAEYGEYTLVIPQVQINSSTGALETVSA